MDCTDYREVDIIPRTDNAERAVKAKRGKRKKVTEPKQRELNDKNARRYVVQLGNGNFGKGDLHVTCTYAQENLPKTTEEAERTVRNYLRRLEYRRAKKGLQNLKYILVTEYKYPEEDEKEEHPVRIHHHIIMNGGMSRDEVEMMWTNTRIHWRAYEKDPEAYAKTVKKIGYCNADRLQPNENGIEALLKYMMKNPRGKKRWSSSRNLARPMEHPPADRKYTRNQIQRLAMSSDNGRSFFEKKFPGYQIQEVRPEYYDETGWHIYLKMWKKEQEKGEKARWKKKKPSGRNVKESGQAENARKNRQGEE